MSELAFNINGEAFELPAAATGWRVRRMKLKGAPEVVYSRDGLPLVLPIDAELDDLRREVDVVGRYRLDPVDDSFKAVPAATSAYIQVNHTDPPPVSNPSAAPAISAGNDGIIIEAMRMNAELAKSVVDRFPQMMEAAAALLRAADGAGLPARQPRAVDVTEEDEDDDEGDVTSGSTFDFNALIAQLVPMAMMALKGKKTPSVGAVLDWRKAASEASADATAKHVKTAPAIPENASDVLPPIDAETMTHFIAIQSALKPEEAAVARDVAGNLSAAELHAWFDELKKLTVPQAVQKIRVLIAGNTEAVQ